MKPLILTCNTGEGHNSSAAAICEEFAQLGIECSIEDSLSFVSEKVSDFIGGWHSRIYRYIPGAFRKGYGYSEKHESLFSERSPINKFFRAGIGKLKDYIEAEEYDCIICVHAFAALMITEIKRKYNVSFSSFFVATDYTCSPSVASTTLDLYFIPHGELINEFYVAGLPKSKLFASGIPVRREFYEKVDKLQAKRAFDIPAEKKHVILMCGSMGCGRVDEFTLKIAKSLPENSLLTVVCGRNKKSYDTLSESAPNNVNVLGFVKDIPLLMSSADLFITKPGGISITEAASKGLPMLFFDIVGGCESRNFDFFLNKEWAISGDDIEDVAEKCCLLLNSESELDIMSDRLLKEFSINSAKLLCDTAIKNTSPLRRDEKVEQNA